MRPLRERLEDVPQTGTLAWIGLRPAADAAMIVVDHCEVIEDRGLAGDRAAKRSGGNRQVTLIQAEHLPVIARLCGLPAVAPERLRRNLVIEGINLVALQKLRFAIGDVILAGTGPCAPCGTLDETIGPGAFQATRGHGGITAKVVRGGVIRVGDRVRVVGAR